MHPIGNVDLLEKDGRTFLELTYVAPTLGYQVTLEAVIYVEPPEDKIQEFTLTVIPPQGMALPALDVIELKGELPDWAEGARIVDPKFEPIVSIRKLILKGEPVGDDMLFVESAGIKDDKLIVHVSYSGGCARHDFRLTWDGTLAESAPPQALLSLSHNANGDLCKAYLRERVVFDLSPHFEGNDDTLIRLDFGSGPIPVHRVP